MGAGVIAEKRTIEENNPDPRWEPGRRYRIAAYAKDGLLIEMTKRNPDDSVARIGLRVSSDRKIDTPEGERLHRKAMDSCTALSKQWKKLFSGSPIIEIQAGDTDFKQAQYDFGFDITVGAIDNSTLKKQFIDTLAAVLEPSEQTEPGGSNTRAWATDVRHGKNGAATVVGKR